MKTIHTEMGVGPEISSIGVQPYIHETRRYNTFITRQFRPLETLVLDKHTYNNTTHNKHGVPIWALAEGGKILAIGELLVSPF